MPGVGTSERFLKVVARTDTATVMPAREGLRVLDVLAALLDVTGEGHEGTVIGFPPATAQDTPEVSVPRGLNPEPHDRSGTRWTKSPVQHHWQIDPCQQTTPAA